MSLTTTFRPLSTWPWPVTAERIRAQFGKSAQSTMGSWRSKRELTLFEATQRLVRELEAIEARDVVVEVDVAEGKIRNDGGLYSGTRAASPRVVVNFVFEHGAMRYKSDRYTRLEDNLAAIAATLEALRTVDRHGVSSRGEQYVGWKALPEQTITTLDSAGAAKLVQMWGGPDALDFSRILVNADLAKEAIRTAAKFTHPDSATGSTEKFQQLQLAKRVLEQHHGRSL